jgi:flavin reductase (DIM6/NTAB) family NADH-FMN oxidoreductase RutF
MHRTIEPTILYFGTPVALISTMNPDGTANLVPMSSAWWLGWTCMPGLGQMSRTSDNRLALTTARNPVPEKKQQWGYRHEPDKFATAGLTPVASQLAANAFGVHIVKLHVHEDLLVGSGAKPHIDPERWRPLIMSFCRFFNLGSEAHPSRLADSPFITMMTGGRAA